MKKRYLPFALFLIIPILAICFWALNGSKESAKGESEKEPEMEEEALARIKQEVLMTKDPKLGYVPVERLEAAKTQWKTRNATGGRSTLSAGGTGTVLGSGLSWTERGPNNIAGRCRAILVDQSDATGNTVLAGSVSGGLWRTINFLNASPSWTQIGSVSTNLAITSLAQDPNSPSTLYAGTGEGYYNFDAVRGLGIYKSTDGGLTWSLLASTTTGGSNQYDFNYVQKLAVYSNGDVYASGISATYCNTGGILRSQDGGNSWTRVIGTFSAGNCSNAIDFHGYDIEFSLNGDIYATVINDSALYNASPGNPIGKIYKSPAGATAGNPGSWTEVTPTPISTNWQRIQVACSQTNNNRLYAVLQGPSNSIGGIERSDDGGITWTNISSSTTWCDGGSSHGTDFSRGQAWYDLAIAVNPANDAQIFVGGVDIMTSTNSGASWTQLTQWASGCTSLPYVHSDIHTIGFLPGSSSSFIVGCDGGVFYTANSGASFASKDLGLNITQYYATALHPSTGSNYMLAGAQDNGSHIFKNSGINTVTTATGGDGGFCFIDQHNPNYQITSFPYAYYTRSTDGGTTFSYWDTTTAGHFINPGDYDNSLQYLYCGGADRKLRRIGPITSGSPVATNITISPALLQVSAVKVDPNTTDSVWVAFSTADDASSNQVPILYVIGGASTGTRTVTKLSNLSLVAGSYISSIDVENGNDNHLLLTVSNYGVASVWESTDKGTSWTSLDNNGVNLPDVPVRWGLIVPAGSNVGTGGPNGGILLATEMGVFSTNASNGTSTAWTQNSSTLGNVRTDMLRFRAADNYLVAATHGRGLFSTNLLTAPLAVHFVSFTGNTQNNFNSLFWSVENEVDNKGYSIEREYEGEDQFSALGFVPSLSGSTSNRYQFADNSVDLGKPTVYYRLKSTDLNGQSIYSSTLVLNRKASSKMVEYISVANSQIYLRVNNGNASQTLHAEIFDMAGRQIFRQNIPFESQNLDIHQLAKGVYVLRLVSNSGGQFSQKFVN